MVQVWTAVTATLLLIVAGAALAADWPITTFAGVAIGLALMTLVFSRLATRSDPKRERRREWWPRANRHWG